jgi:hypothetical protein
MIILLIVLDMIRYEEESLHARTSSRRYAKNIIRHKNIFSLNLYRTYQSLSAEKSDEVDFEAK